MELRLQKFIDQAIGIADVRNLSPENPIELSITSPNSSQKTRVVVAVNEPWQYIALPVNVTWINYNPQDPYYKRALKRVSRTQSATYQHTWTLLNNYIDIFEPPQYYDAESGDVESRLDAHIANLNNPHIVTPEQIEALPLTGGQMLGPILSRPATINQFANEELIPRKVVDALQLSIDQQIQQILQSISGGSVVPHIHNQSTPSNTWTIDHQFNSVDMMIQIVAADGEIVSPADISYSANNTVLTFVTAEAGKAYVFKASA
jgi:hypothetical protein